MCVEGAAVLLWCALVLCLAGCACGLCYVLLFIVSCHFLSRFPISRLPSPPFCPPLALERARPRRECDRVLRTPVPLRVEVVYS